MAERTLGVVLFPGFELLDVFGPLEAFGGLPGLFRVLLVAERAGPVASAQGVRAVADHGLADCPRLDLLLVPGGIGTREEVENRTLLDWLAPPAPAGGNVTSPCPGRGLPPAPGPPRGRGRAAKKAFFPGGAGRGPPGPLARGARSAEELKV